MSTSYSRLPSILGSVPQTGPHIARAFTTINEHTELRTLYNRLPKSPTPPHQQKLYNHTLQPTHLRPSQPDGLTLLRFSLERIAFPVHDPRPSTNQQTAYNIPYEDADYGRYLDTSTREVSVKFIAKFDEAAHRMLWPRPRFGDLQEWNRLTEIVIAHPL